MIATQWVRMAAGIAEALRLVAVVPATASIGTVECRTFLPGSKLHRASIVYVASRATHAVRASGVIKTCRSCRKQYLPLRVEIGLCKDCIEIRARDLEKFSQRSMKSEEEKEKRAREEKARQRRDV